MIYKKNFTLTLSKGRINLAVKRLTALRKLAWWHIHAIIDVHGITDHNASPNRPKAHRNKQLSMRTHQTSFTRCEMFKTEKRVPMSGSTTARILLDHFNFPQCLHNGELVEKSEKTLENPRKRQSANEDENKDGELMGTGQSISECSLNLGQ